MSQVVLVVITMLPSTPELPELKIWAWEVTPNKAIAQLIKTIRCVLIINTVFDYVGSLVRSVLKAAAL